MMKQSVVAALMAQLVSLAAAGTTAWSGSFNDVTTASLADWSWSNQVGEYQWYIFGTGETADYLAFDASYANSADSTSTAGAKITLTDTSYWNGQTMRRTELIPQASDTSAITSGTLYYHFSLKREDTNAPSTAREHQIAFFESHFTELQYGLSAGGSGDGDDTLRWMAASTEQWNVTMGAGTWHNFAYEIDFDGSTVGLWYSSGGDELTQVVAPVSASVSSNGADWHVGVLELAVDGVADATEDFYWSGVYIESGDLTTTFSGSASSGSSSDSASSAAPVASSAAASSAAPVAASSSVAPVVQASSAPVLSSAPVATSAAALPTLASSASSKCTRTKTVYVTASAY